MTTNIAAAAEALVALIPTVEKLTVTTASNAATAPAFDRTVTASFIGSTSVDFTLSVNHDTLDQSATTGVPVTDVLRPALEAAATLFGAGVLGDVKLVEDVIHNDNESTVFSIRTSQKTDVGTIVIRVRASAGNRGNGNDTDVTGKLSRINDVEMALTVQIGKTSMSVRDVLSLEPGAVVELDRSAGAPADILLNGRVIAHGEVVVVDADYAVRVTRILDVPGVN